MIFVAVLVFLASFGVCDTLTHKDREVTAAGQGLWHQSCYFADIFVFADSYSIHCAKPMFIQLLYISIKHALSMRKGLVYSYFGGLTNWLKACSSDHDTICLPVFKNVKSKESTCSRLAKMGRCLSTIPSTPSFSKSAVWFFSLNLGGT